jgi:hypothetical protein
MAQDNDLHVLGVGRLAKTSQPEDLLQDHESQGAHHHGLILTGRHRAWSPAGR